MSRNNSYSLDIEKSAVNDTAFSCDASLYMTYTKSLKASGLAKPSGIVKAEEIAVQLGVSVDDVLIAWIDEMGRLHK